MQDIEKLLDKENLDILNFFDDKNISTIGGMTDFQIQNFVLNRKEHPTDYAVYKQAKLEIGSRLMNLIGDSLEYKKNNIKIEILKHKIKDPKDEITKLQNQLKEIDIEKLRLANENLIHRANKSAIEIKSFYKKYKQLEHFNNITNEEARQLEEETWLIKSAYFIELQQRYGLTPDGVLKLPHEVGGIEKLKNDFRNNQIAYRKTQKELPDNVS